MAMRGNNNVKTLAVVLVAVCLVALAQTQQAQAAHCCCRLQSPLLAAYSACRIFGGVQTCCPYCTGYMSNNVDCQSGYGRRTVNLQRASETDYSNEVVDFCKIGCMTTVSSNKIDTSVVGGTDGGKDVMERVTSGCHDFCTKGNAKIAEVHGA